MKKILIYIVLFFLFSIPLFAQIKDKSLLNLNLNKEYFFLDPLVFYNKDSSNARLDLYIELPLENIQFKRNPATDKYDAYIIYTIEIKDFRGQTVFNNTYTESMSNTENEQKSVSEKSVYAVKHYDLSYGKYKINFLFKDKNIQKEYTKDLEISVPDFKKKNVTFSDIMLIGDYSEDENGKKEITPLITRNVGNLKEFRVFFEAYNNTDSTINNVYDYKITSEKGKVILDGSYNYFLDPGVNKKIEKISTALFLMGNFTYEIVDKRTKELCVKKDLVYRWENMPVNIKDINEAIQQLLYIATNDEFKYLKAAKTNEEKERRFLKFWRDKDPTPNTPKNEVMIEYYNRIRIANDRYSHYVEGWKTDMGMVYITYGDPNNIERHPFDPDTKPYEVWDYYDKSRRFIFVDYTGFGDYRLTNPMWDERNKLRY